MFHLTFHNNNPFIFATDNVQCFALCAKWIENSGIWNTQIDDEYMTKTGDRWRFFYYKTIDCTFELFTYFLFNHKLNIFTRFDIRIVASNNIRTVVSMKKLIFTFLFLVGLLPSFHSAQQYLHNWKGILNTFRKGKIYFGCRKTAETILLHINFAIYALNTHKREKRKHESWLLWISFPLIQTRIVTNAKYTWSWLRFSSNVLNSIFAPIVICVYYMRTKGTIW